MWNANNYVEHKEMYVHLEHYLGVREYTDAFYAQGWCYRSLIKFL